ncbi:MAG: sulfite exporter TauE/SafE family protein [Flavobacteriales bacterium]
MEMSLTTIAVLAFIGLLAGLLSGFVGIGGGMVIVPGLIYLLGKGQLEAQGTSLAVIMMPVGILGVMNYYKAGHININFALVIAAMFVIGSYFGSKYALKIPEYKIKVVFGIFLLYIAIRMLISGTKQWLG